MTHILRIDEMVSNAKVYLYEYANELWISKKPLNNDRVNGRIKLHGKFNTTDEAYMRACEIQDYLGTETYISSKLINDYAKELGYQEDDLDEFYKSVSVFDEDTMEPVEL